MSKFQIIFITCILLLIVLALLVFSGIIPGLPGRERGDPTPLVMWGTFSKSNIEQTLGILNTENKNIFFVKYFEKDSETYENELINALASGKGPDIFFLTQDLILKHSDKLHQISFESFSERDFKDTFIDASEILLTNQGIMAVPIFVDPIVLYWNKDLFSKAGLAESPKDWQDFLNFSQLLTKSDEAGNIFESGTAMGEFSNIKNAKDIFSMLILQSGNKIVESKTFELKFGQKGSSFLDPVTSALTFYTSFSNPSKVSYSWNRALPNSVDRFVSGKLAMYFDYGSKIYSIRQKNPHLNFDVTKVPQVEDAIFEASFGRLHSLAVSKLSPNTNQATHAVYSFLDKDIWEKLQSNVSLPPASRDLLAKGNTDPFMSVFYKSAIQSRSWLEPDSERVSEIFKNMIESIVTGKKSISRSAIDAKILLQEEMWKVIK